MCHEYSDPRSLPKCPVCGKPVPANEWVSYMKCEDCWAGSSYLPTNKSSSVVGIRTMSDRRRYGRGSGE